MYLIHSKIIEVDEGHLDEFNHVNNVQYVQWVEEIAKEHWELVKADTPYPNDFWVMADHHIQYKKQVYKGDDLKILTYPQNPEGIRQPRKVEFYRGDELVADSRTLWVLIDNESKKIKRIAENWLETLNKG